MYFRTLILYFFRNKFQPYYTWKEDHISSSYSITLLIISFHILSKYILLHYINLGHNLSGL